MHPKKFYKTRYNLLLNIIKDTKRPVSRYALVGDIEIPFGVILMMPVFEDDDIDKIQKEMLKTKGIEIKYGIITRILLGRFCYRLFDHAYSVQHKVLTEQFNIKRMEKLDY